MRGARLPARAPARLQDVPGRGARRHSRAHHHGEPHVREARRPRAPVPLLSPDPLERVSLEQLLKAAAKGLAPRPEPTVRTDADHITVRASVSARRSKRCSRCSRRAAGAASATSCATSPARNRGDRSLPRVPRALKQGMIDLDQCDNFGDLLVRMLAPGERVELDLESLADWATRKPRRRSRRSSTRSTSTTYVPIPA